ncbi:MAG: Ureidoglycolate hydrolase, partial [Neglectibacter sp.]
CVARVSECERIITALEYHQFTCEGILPLDGDIDIFVGPSSFRVDPATVEAFRVPQGTFVKLNPGVLHGRQFVVNTPAVNVLVLLPERTFGNDCTFTMLEGEDRIRILP